MAACIKHEILMVCKGHNMQHMHEDSSPVAQVLALCLFNSAEVIYPPMSSFRYLRLISSE